MDLREQLLPNEKLLTEYTNLFIENKIELSRELFCKILPILSFTHQHIDIAIKFSKMLRVKEGIFETSLCRSPVKSFDSFQQEEANLLLRQISILQDNLT